MQVILQHPVHGRKIATMEAEVLHDRMHGWRVVTPDPEPAITVETDSDPVVNEMAPKRRSRRVAQTES